MPQTLVISTPDAVSTTSRTFPKQGVFNLKITKNDKFDTVEIWMRSAAVDITLELEGASFQSTAQQGVQLRTTPPNPTVISGSTLALTRSAVNYMKIKLNNGISVAHLRCSYDARVPNSLVAGGNVKDQAFVDYSKKPYISTSLERMFVEDSVKNDLTKWDVSSVINMVSTFAFNVNFNQPIGNWDVSNVTTMNVMFDGATSFNQPIGDWNVSNVTHTGVMFRGATSFNQPIGDWNVSNVTNMSGMFNGAINFNQPIGDWNVSNVTNMSSMFAGAANFNQDLSSWAAKFNVDVSLVSFFGTTPWGTTNYDKFLNALWVDINTTRPQAWTSRTIAKVLGMGTSKYSEASEAARTSLVSNGWTIIDGGLAA